MSVRAWWVFAAACFLTTSLAVAQPTRSLIGRSVSSVLDDLRRAGAPIVYSSNLLSPSLRVASEPTATTPLEIAREILVPHGLAVRDEAGVWLVVRDERPRLPPQPGEVAVSATAFYAGTPLESFAVAVDAANGIVVEGVDGRAEITLLPGRYTLRLTAPGFLPERVQVAVSAGATAPVSIALLEVTPKLDELVVTASRYDVSDRTQPSATDFSRDEIESLALLGDDTVRVAHRLPGVANNEFSARSYVRGGAANEVAVILDGIQLIEPYHLRDFQAAFSTIDQRVVERVSVHAGGFPAAYGDALSGLMVIEPREPTVLAHELGLSVLYTSLLSSGVFADGRASWLVSARNSNLDRVVAEHIGEPEYSDLLVRATGDLGEKHRLVFGYLKLDDDVQFTVQDEPRDRQAASSDTNSHERWLRLDSAWTDTLSSVTWFHTTSFDSARQERVADLDELVGTVTDRRSLTVAGVKQNWRYELSDRQLWSAGFELEEHDAEYRYASVGERLGLLATLGGTAPPLRTMAVDLAGSSHSVYIEDRVRITDRLIADLGLRWDRQSYLPPEADSQFSPRASLLYRMGDRTELRLSHGRFFQPEGLLELQVEDGVGEFSRPQSAAHSIVSVDHRFSNTLALRAEVYRKSTRHVRPHYENLFDPLVLLPELRASRALVAADRADSRGVELLVSSDQPVSWWAGVSFARADDEIGGERVPRSWDQRRALQAGTIWPVGGWNLSAAIALHSGWPATEVDVVTSSDGVTSAVAGPRNTTRLSDFRRVDVGASRDFDVGLGALRFFAEVTNLTDRENTCCLAYEPATLNGVETLTREERASTGITGNIGLLWQF